jgi:hypothetical protein
VCGARNPRITADDACVRSPGCAKIVLAEYAGRVKEPMLFEGCQLVKKEGRTSGVVSVVVSAGMSAADVERNEAAETDGA